MGKMTFEDREKSSKGKTIGLYVSLAVCMLAFGAGTFSLVNRAKPQEGAGEYTTNIYATVEGAGAHKTDVTGQAGTTSGTQVGTTTAATSSVTTGKPAVSDVAEFFVMPVGGSILKEFSDTQLQYSETYNDWRLHAALDIAAEKGTEVHASGNGRVTDIYDDELWGKTVVIDHGNGIRAYYCGLNEPLVKKGDVVEVGAVLGGIGKVTCESVDQPHLHFAVQKGEAWVSPVDALKIGVE